MAMIRMLLLYGNIEMDFHPAKWILGILRMN